MKPSVHTILRYCIPVFIFSIPVLLSFLSEKGEYLPEFALPNQFSFFLSASWIPRSERILFYCLLLASLFIYFSEKAAKGGRSFFFSSQASVSELATLSAFFPLLIHNFLFSLSAYDSLFLGDFDFTMISSALNRTAKWDTILATGFANTGSRGSFLGHHFSPSLFLLLPFYMLVSFAAEIAGTFSIFPDHFLYALLLWGVLFLGGYAWNRLNVFLFGRSPEAFFANLCIAFAYPLWRLSYSFHFEMLLFPLSALFFLAHLQNQKSYWLYFILLAGIKEDMGVYIFFFGIFLFADGFRKKGVLTALLSLFYFIFALFMRHLLAGETGQDFSEYFSPEYNFAVNSKNTFLMLLAFGLLPVLNVKLMIFAILPAAILHGFSRHPWHQAYYSHYVYPLMPFLLLGTSSGMHRLLRRNDSTRIFFSASVVMTLIFYANSLDKDHPFPLFAEDTRYEKIRNLMRQIPEKSCVHAQIPFSAHVPLHSTSYPLFLPENHPERTGLKAFCIRTLYIFDKSDPRPPYYDAAMIENLKKRLDSDADLCASSGSIHLYAEVSENFDSKKSICPDVSGDFFKIQEK